MARSASGHRDQSIVCVVEQHKDLINLEGTGQCDWVYHVLLGHLAPLEGVSPDDLTIDSLVKNTIGWELFSHSHNNTGKYKIPLFSVQANCP